MRFIKLIILITLLTAGIAESASPALDKEAARKLIKQWLDNELQKVVANLKSGEPQRVTPNDQNVTELTLIGPQNVDVLIDALSTQEGQPFSLEIEFAIGRLASAQNKEIIINAMSKCPDLSQVILDKGWYLDARSMLLKIANGNPRKMPDAVILSIARFKDPSTYPLLNEMVGYSPFVLGLHEQAKEINPGINLSQAIEIAWNRKDLSENRDPNGRWHLGLLAYEYGISGAIQYVMYMLEESMKPGKIVCIRPNAYVEEKKIRIAPESWYPMVASKIAGKSFNNASELVYWYKANRETIIYDRKSNLYVVKKHTWMTLFKVIALLSLLTVVIKPHLRQPTHQQRDIPLTVESEALSAGNHGEA